MKKEKLGYRLVNLSQVNIIYITRIEKALKSRVESRNIKSTTSRVRKLSHKINFYALVSRLRMALAVFESSSHLLYK